MSHRLWLSLGTMAIALFARCAHAQTEAADLILVNGRVFTGTDNHPYAEAIAIKGDRIVAVDSNRKITALAGPKTQRIDLAGRLVIPGMMDTHNHYSGDPLPEVTSVDFGEWAPTCKHVLEVLEQAVAKVPTGKLITGNMGPEAFFDPGCTPAALDRIAPQHPVFLMSGTPHGAMLNQAAVKWFGVDTSAPPPLAGWYGKDMKSKKWDGVVHESAALALEVRTVSDGTQDDPKLREFLLQEAKYGVTSNTFLEFNPASRVMQLARVNAPNRIHVVPFAQYQVGPKRRKLEHPRVPASIRDRVTVKGEKWVLDGSPFERSAAMRAPYTDNPSTAGQLDYPEAEIHAILEHARQQNQPLMMHAIGDHTVEVLLNQMEATGGEKIWAARRVRIEHGDGVIGDLIPRAKKLGVIVAQNPTHFVAGDLSLRRFGPERAAIWMPFRTLLDAGIPVVTASDGGPGDPELNPFLNIQLATTYPARPKEAITREQAVLAYTRTAAYSEFADDRLGTLEPGKLADLAVLSQDVFQVPAEDLPKTESVLTLVGGKVAYSSATIHTQSR
jgi:predicted amidohydrolase YtcJ